jgi:hypothetical protein
VLASRHLELSPEQTERLRDGIRLEFERLVATTTPDMAALLDKFAADGRAANCQDTASAAVLAQKTYVP